MSNIQINYQEMESAATRLASGREDITAKLTGLQAEISRLVSSGFITDSASHKFHDSYNRYTQSANQVIAQLSEIEAFLHQTSSAIREMDMQIAARIQ